MTRLLKLILVILATLVVLGVAALLIVYFYLGSIVKTGIETVGPKLTQCPLTVSSVRASLLSGSFEIEGLTVGNPEGFKTPSAIKLGRVRILVEMKTLWSDCIVVREIFIGAPDITFEKSLTGSNIATIQRNIASTTGAGGSAAQPAPPAGGKPGKKVQIDRVTIRNGQINLSVAGVDGQALPVPLPEIVLEGIGKRGTGVTLAEAAGEILQGLLKSVAHTVLKNPDVLKRSAEAAGNRIPDSASGLLKGAKDIFSK